MLAMTLMVVLWVWESDMIKGSPLQLQRIPWGRLASRAPAAWAGLLDTVQASEKGIRPAQEPGGSYANKAVQWLRHDSHHG
jgi:hypothetical protein